VVGSIVAGLAGFALFTIGVGALAAPGISSVQYGLPATDRTALALVRAIGARDLALGTLILLLLAGRNRSALGHVLAVSMIAALGDAVAVKTGRSDARPRNLALHFGGGAALLVAWGLVRSGR